MRSAASSVRDDRSAVYPRGSGERTAYGCYASLIEADANRQHSAPEAEWDPARVDVAAAPRAVREQLSTLDEAAFGAAREVQPKFTSFSDPASQWTAARTGPAFCADHEFIIHPFLNRGTLPFRNCAAHRFLCFTLQD
jgi:hypothetical protein